MYHVELLVNHEHILLLNTCPFHTSFIIFTLYKLFHVTNDESRINNNVLVPILFQVTAMFHEIETNAHDADMLHQDIRFHNLNAGIVSHLL